MLFKLSQLLAGSFCMLLFTSCQIYSPTFDCPPREGVPCTSVTEIEGMIVETKKGADLFVGGEEEQRAFWRTMVARSVTDTQRCVWINTTKDKYGNCISGHYIYLRTFNKEAK